MSVASSTVARVQRLTHRAAQFRSIPTCHLAVSDPVTLTAYRCYVSRAHPKPIPSFSVREALDKVMDGIEERKIRRAERWERNKERICASKGIKEDGPYRNVDETIELAVNLNLDPRKPGQALRGSLRVPHGTGKRKSVAVFTTSEETAAAARKAGAAAAGGKELVQEIIAGTVPIQNLDVSLATPDAMSVLSPLARLLGPRGLMPNAKVGTVKSHDEIVDATSEHVNATQVPYRADKEGIIHAGIAKGSLGSDKILDNIRAFMQGMHDVQPENFGKGKKKGKGKSKGRGDGKNSKFFLKVYLASSQGKGFQIDLRTIDPKSSFFMSEVSI